VQQILSFYIYDNTMVVLELTGRQIKEALEYAARTYQNARMDAESGVLHIETDPRIMPYNFDILAGAHYRIDPMRPVGDRIRDLTYRGKPIDPNARFKLVTTNYRAAGGGRYRMLEDAKVLWRSSKEIRNLMIEHIREKGTIQPYCDYNWVVAPDIEPSDFGRNRQPR
jgi:2',3'-cyclic-nucleotide 2'-phosphodiesterase/3'-nucleotidase